ncbi:sushi, von Willebrand factor type A, EGF and pentraxin domain-containing protein 1-like [Gigantopelta aegis]|uniref:sushi, von Willebrand factor type A, EGF and pentraxin domain-containing protein 1-like n=1 Tax=Gigantopelta aegis TaxID=1735272 RepID=UPI001B88DBA1|nr:sushi, von Willebrand factor type A, EGF and pentraxin domain-containing protein 1-like [Gigantopelta aegis]
MMDLLPKWTHSWILLLEYLVLVTVRNTDAACPSPPFVPNASVLQAATQQGNRVTYRCDDGFQLVNGPAQILCQENNQWTQVEFHCKAPGCSHPTLIPNANPLTTHERFTGATVTYECETGFTLENGPAEIVCRSSGIWSEATFRCKAGITCLQCNVFVRGTLNTCDNPSIRTQCYACLKTHTKVLMHDRWGQQKVSEVTSRYCVMDVTSAIYKQEGCYIQRNNGGYTQRCYCYADKCNGAENVTFTLTTVLACILSFISATY